jgi:hypothetical protein
MWYDERANKPEQPTNPKYSLCYMQGDVKLDFLKQPRTYLRELLSIQVEETPLILEKKFGHIILYFHSHQWVLK